MYKNVAAMRPHPSKNKDSILREMHALYTYHIVDFVYICMVYLPAMMTRANVIPG